jgi:hypothetical protein
VSKKSAQPGMRVRLESVYAPTYRVPGLPLDGVVLTVSPSRALVLVRFDDAVQNYVRTEDLVQS